MKRFATYTAAALMSMTFWACDREDEGFDGPNLEDLYGDFRVLDDIQTSRTTVDFANGEDVHFTASTSIATEWVIEITGQQTGAQKTISGKSRIIDADNSTWNGSTTIFPVFAEEPCDVKLYFPGYEDTLISSVTVTGKKINDGLLVTDFEDETAQSDWDLFIQSGADMSFNFSDQGTVPESNLYFDMGGEVNWDWLIGYLYLPATALGTPTFELNTDPEVVYFNCLVHIPEGINNALLLLQFPEDDNEDGSHNANTEDMWAYELRPSDIGTGWQTLSLRYSDMVTLVNGAPGDPAGNGLHEPNKLLQVNFLMLANPASGYSQTLIDYVIFTENGPLQP